MQKSMIINFSKKNILVTGHTRGIGLAIFNQFQKLGGNVEGVSSKDVDFEDTEKLFVFFEKLLSEMQFDIVINCAGTNEINYIQDIDFESEYRKIMKINTDTPFIISKMVIPSMIQNGFGRIINIGSVFGTVTREKRAVYTMSKHALIGLTKTLSVEVAKHNILVNTVSPTSIHTELTERILGNDGMEDMKTKIPIGRLAKPEEIANIVMFLCSDYNTYLTGQNIIVDGGYTNV